MITSRLQLKNETEQLETDLRLAHEAYQEAAKDRPDEADKLAAVRALSAVCNYLRAIGIERRYWEPLLEIWGKMDGARTKEHMDKARAAAAVTLLMKAREKSALKTVAAAAGIDKLQLETFRKNVTGKNPRGPKIAVDLYKRLLSDAARSGLPLREQAQELLRATSGKSDKLV